MDLLHLLDEWFVLLGVSMWLQVHATPIAWAVALGLVVIALLVIRDACAAVRTSTIASPPAGATRRPPRLRTDAVALSLATLTLGARGPRAPGRTPRPSPAR